LGRRRRESLDPRRAQDRKYQRIEVQLRDHGNVLGASSLGTKRRIGQEPTIGRKNPPPFDMTAGRTTERWDLKLMLICERSHPLPLETRRKARREGSEGWLVAEQELIKDEERFLSEKGRVLNLALV